MTHQSTKSYQTRFSTNKQFATNKKSQQTRGHGSGPTAAEHSYQPIAQA
jgi:hypothetical protein